MLEGSTESALDLDFWQTHQKGSEIQAGLYRIRRILMGKVKEGLFWQRQIKTTQAKVLKENNVFGAEV